LSGSIPSNPAFPADHLAENFVNKTVPLKFRGTNLSFDLSQGLFSSADIDFGTRLLLKELSALLDRRSAAGLPPPERVLDAGCGIGVLGICAAAAIPGCRIRCQDRDELARIFTLRNALRNGIAETALEAHAEPLLAGAGPWDLILSNIPAKAGEPVLEDFVARSLRLLRPEGTAAIVVVSPLAEFFRRRITLCGAKLLREIPGSGHAVFVYGRAEEADGTEFDLHHEGGPSPPPLQSLRLFRYPPSGGSTPATPPPLLKADSQKALSVKAGPDFLARNPFYLRGKARALIEKTELEIAGIHGCAGFDDPGDAARVMAKLILRLKPDPAGSGILIHEGGQGFFPCWLAGAGLPENAFSGLILSGRNVLSLWACRDNLARQIPALPVIVVPAADLMLAGESLARASGSKGFSLIIAFPELLPQSSLPKGCDQLRSFWESLPPLMAEGGTFLSAFDSSAAERFDRKKPSGFTRLGGIRKNGFRALAYRFGLEDKAGF